MRKYLFIICLFLMIVSPAIVHADNLLLQYDGQQVEYTGAQYNLVVNNNKIDPPLPPIIFNDRALVPIREVFEALGASVSYVSQTQQIYVESSSIKVRLQINSNDAYINGNKVSIPDGVVPKLIGKVGEPAKTMVPVRFISESIGVSINFDEISGTINISTSPEATNPPLTNTSSIAITNIEYKQSDNETIVVVQADKQISEFNNFNLSDPSRIVVDITGAKLNAKQNIYTFNGDVVKSVRLGEHESSTRVVIDVNMPPSYNAALSADRTQLILYISNTGENTPSTSTPTPTEKPDYIVKKIVVIDAGHGGSDPGASGSLNGTEYYEKDFTLSVALKVKKILNDNGIEVVMTRETDIYPTLEARAELANSIGAALFVSIHANSYDTASPNGTEVFYAKNNNESYYNITSEQMADYILKDLISQVGTKNRGVKTANHVVTRTCSMPAVLVEVGFLSNANELSQMITDDFQQKAAQGIANGIIKAYNLAVVPTQQSYSQNNGNKIIYLTDMK